MHGSPPCAITVARFGAWRAAVAVLALAALAALLAWFFTSPLGAGAWVRAGVAVAALAILALAASLWRQPAVRLRWDGHAWTVATPAGGPEVSGRLEIAIDLGLFLLLRFTPAGRSGPAAVRWIPVGRAGLEHDWHAFRCAVHSPQPAAGAAAAEPRRP
jgi:hypothetical protein